MPCEKKHVKEAIPPRCPRFFVTLGPCVATKDGMIDSSRLISFSSLFPPITPSLPLILSARSSPFLSPLVFAPSPAHSSTFLLRPCFLQCGVGIVFASDGQGGLLVKGFVPRSTAQNGVIQEGDLLLQVVPLPTNRETILDVRSSEFPTVLVPDKQEESLVLVRVSVLLHRTRHGWVTGFPPFQPGQCFMSHVPRLSCHAGKGDC